MKNSHNKTELFKLIADEISQTQSPALLVATKEDEAVTNKPYDTSRISPCNQSDADTRVMCHVADIDELEKILVLTVDTDLVVIALGVFHKLNTAELWIEMGVGGSKQWIPIHKYSQLLGEDVCKALPFWFALTGCDTTSHFYGIGKLTAWKTWTAFPDVTGVFARYSSYPYESDFLY